MCALFDAFRRHHDREAAEVVLHSKLEAVAGLFDVPYRVDDAVVEHAQRNQAFQRSHDNQLLASPLFYAHPSFMRSGVRVDQLTARAGWSQADMYRMMLRLPPDTPLALPRIPATARTHHVLVIDKATSWANSQPLFWEKLVRALEAAGRYVVRNDPDWTLEHLLRRCAAAEWVIGPQCGVMSILAAGRFPCRKTFASPSMDYNVLPDQWMDHTYPYGYVTKFDGADYDVEEFKITDDNHDEIAALIAGGSNALELLPHDPSPVLSVSVPLSPGDFLDRLAILMVKRDNFDRIRRALIEREYQRYCEALFRLRASDRISSEVEGLFSRLISLHSDAFHALKEVVPERVKLEASVEAHAKVVELNRERVKLKNLIDALCHAPYAEVKDYYKEDPW